MFPHLCFPTPSSFFRTSFLPFTCPASRLLFSLYLSAPSLSHSPSFSLSLSSFLSLMSQIRNGDADLQLSSSEDTLEKQLYEYVSNRHGWVDSLDEGLRQLRQSGGGLAMLLPSYKARYLTSRHCDLIRTGHGLDTVHYAFAFPASSRDEPLRWARTWDGVCVCWGWWEGGGGCGGRVCLFVGCLTSQQYASVSQGLIYSDIFTCCHTETEVADQTFHLTQSQYTDTWPTCPSADPITPGAWQGSHWSANFEVTGVTRPRKNPVASGIGTRDLPLSRRTP